MLAFLQREPPDGSLSSNDIIRFSFSKFKYERRPNSTLAGVSEESVNERIESLINQLNSRITKERKHLRRLSLLAYFVLVIFGILLIFVLGSFVTHDRVFLIKSEATGNNENKANIMTCLGVTGIVGLLYIFWSKYRTGKEILEKAESVIERQKDSFQTMGLEIKILDKGFFPDYIQIFANSLQNQHQVINISVQEDDPGQLSHFEVEI